MIRNFVYEKPYQSNSDISTWGKFINIIAAHLSFSTLIGKIYCVCDDGVIGLYYKIVENKLCSQNH